MNEIDVDQPAALDLISRLARHLATEMDIYYDSFPEDAFGEELRILRKAKSCLNAAGLPVPDVINHVLAGGANNALSS